VIGLLLAAALAIPAQKPAQSPEAQAFDAAFLLKKQQKSDQAAAAFEDIVRRFSQSPRVGEAKIEAGVGWFGFARSQLVLNRATPASDEAFAKALKVFSDFVREHPEDPLAGRAQYMVGSTRFFQGDLAGAEADYDAVLAKFPSDLKYVPKSLERRSAMRRHLLEADLAIQDLRRYEQQYPQGEDLAAVRKYLGFASMFEKPAPALRVRSWIQGGPVALGQGRVVGLFFFATWCEKCEKQRLFLIDLANRYAPAGLAMVGVVNDGKGQTVESVKTWLGQNGVAYPVMMDSRPSTADEYGASTIPDLVLVDKQGRVRWHDNPELLQDYTLGTLLAEEAAPPPPK
jgi:tetratricopeptide (TPR) repeat protein